MADHLPEDPRRWPGDPFELLGVERSASETDIRRAYTRLIRKFKPEHFPEQFRRIREAYEAALQQRKWFGFIHFDPPAEDDPAPAIVTAESTGTETAPRDEPRELERPRPVARPEEAAWALAIAGKRAEGYSQLAELARAKSENSELALRLYWLLAIEPAIDEDRTRHDWLAEALRRSCLRGEAVELYRRELEASPEQALLGPYENILKCDATSNDRLSLSRLRVSAAAIARKWNVIDAELEFLAREPGDFAETAWLSYLVIAMGILHFEYPPKVYRRCKDLLGGLRHLELREAWVFDQLDE
ncbi:MAG TPA: J domain-containing protein [Gemmata sp.]|nr:J domain-containing protein [Gemmata sp.]